MNLYIYIYIYIYREEVGDPISGRVDTAVWMHHLYDDNDEHRHVEGAVVKRYEAIYLMYKNWKETKALWIYIYI